MLNAARLGMKASYFCNEFDGTGTVYGIITEIEPGSHIIMTESDGNIRYYLAPELTDEDHVVKFYDENGAVIYSSQN